MPDGLDFFCDMYKGAKINMDKSNNFEISLKLHFVLLYSHFLAPRKLMKKVIVKLHFALHLTFGGGEGVSKNRFLG